MYVRLLPKRLWLLQILVQNHHRFLISMCLILSKSELEDLMRMRMFALRVSSLVGWQEVGALRWSPFRRKAYEIHVRMKSGIVSMYATSIP